MRTALTWRFQSDVHHLGAEARAAALDVVRALPSALNAPELHRKLGMRRLHRSGVWSARVGLGLRLVFAVEGQTLVLVTVASRRFAKAYLRRGLSSG